MEGRLGKRLARFVVKRTREARFSAVKDPRSKKGRKRPLGPLLATIVAAICAGVKSLAMLEGLTGRMSQASRAALGINGRLPDTTVRDVLVRLPLEGLRQCLHLVNRHAQARKALEPIGLPFGVVSMDGKTTAIDHLQHPFVQRQRHGGSATGASGLVRTVTSVLQSARAKVILDVSPIPGETNEDGHFATALAELVKAYRPGAYFQMVAYDSGACSKANADTVTGHGLWYFFRLDSKQPTILLEAERLLGDLPTTQGQVMTEDVTGTGSEKRFVFVTGEIAGWHDWEHLTTALRVRSEKYDKAGRLVEEGERYYISSCPDTKLTAKQWLAVARQRWSVENQAHHTLDAVLKEDERPWISSDAQGMLAVLILRRIACTLLALFRSVTQRSEERRLAPWRTLIDDVEAALLTARPEHFEGVVLCRASAPPA